MRVLVVTAFSPSQKTAGQNQTLRTLRRLQVSCSLDIVYFSSEKATALANPRIDANVQRVPTSFGSRVIGALCLPIFYPLFTVRFDLGFFIQLQKISRDYDLILFDFSQTFIYAYLTNHPFKVLMAHDAISQQVERIRVPKLVKRWARWTERILTRSGKLLCFSDKDRAIFREVSGSDAIVVDFYLDENIASVKFEDVAPYFCFFGAWSRWENLESLEWFVDNIGAVVPELRFKVVGGGLTRSKKIELESKGFEVVGFVENPYPVLANSCGLVAPLLHGAGVKVKVIEALACGIPVIGSSIALEGLTNVGRNMFLAETAGAYRDALRRAMVVSVEEKRRNHTDFCRHYPRQTIPSLLANRWFELKKRS